MCHSVLTDVAYVIRFNLIIFLQEIYIYVLQHIYTLSLFLTYLLTYLLTEATPTSHSNDFRTTSQLSQPCKSDGFMRRRCPSVCLFVCLWSVKYMKSFARWQHLAASVGLSHRCQYTCYSSQYGLFRRMVI